MRLSGATLGLASMLALASVGASPAFAGYVGTSATVNYEWPTLGTVLYAGGTSTVVTGGTSYSMAGGGALATVANGSITLTFPDGWSFSTAPKTFDGVVVRDTGVNIAGVSLASTNIAGYVSSDLSSDANDVFIDFPFPPFSSLAAGATLTVDVRFVTSAVPEPSALVLLAAGLLGIGAVHRSLRRG